MQSALDFHGGARTPAIILAAAAFAVTALWAGIAAGAAPAVGDTYVYRVVNGYNNEARGKIEYRVDQIGADRVVMSVTTDVPALGAAR